jgi:hypothetical protein
MGVEVIVRDECLVVVPSKITLVENNGTYSMPDE